jgi:hypothetical protein
MIYEDLLRASACSVQARIGEFWRIFLARNSDAT